MTIEDSIIIEQFVEKALEEGPKNTQEGKLFSQEEVERIRKQEKDKLYKKIEESENRFKTLSEQLSVIEQERQEARHQAEELSQREREITKQREEAELSAKELLLRKEDEFNKRISQTEQEWQSRFEQLEQQRAAQEALLEKERAYQALQAFKQQRIAQESENIIPELIDLISGNSEEEIESSIDMLRERSNAIVASIQQATQSAPGRLRGTPTTGAPPVGPLDNQMEQKTYTVEDLRNMPMNEFAKNRDRLLSAARPNRGRF